MDSKEGVMAPKVTLGYGGENPIQVTGAPPVAPPAAPLVAYAGLTGSSEKKKRGRPRKYGSDGPISVPFSSASGQPATGNFSGENTVTSEKKQKKKKRMGAEKLDDWISCSTGINFLPHTLTVNAGEDVSMKVISFCQQGPRAICIISGTGEISNVTLRQPDGSGGTRKYEGRFDIISLSGSFTPTEFGGSESRTGGMSIVMQGPDGRVVGGLLAGLVIAASAVKVVVGSFLPTSHHDVAPKRQKLMLTNEVSNVEQQVSSTANQTSAYAAASSTQNTNGAPSDARKIAATSTDINLSLQKN